MRNQSDLSAVCRRCGIVDPDLQVEARQRPDRSRRPFDQQHRGAGQQVPNAQRLHFIGIDQAVQIQVINLNAVRLIRLDQRVSGTADGPGNSVRAQNSTDQGRFARAQLTFQRDNDRGIHEMKRVTDRQPKRLHLFRRGDVQKR